MKQAILITIVLIIVSAAVYFSCDETAASRGRDYMADAVGVWFPIHPNDCICDACLSDDDSARIRFDQ